MIAPVWPAWPVRSAGLAVAAAAAALALVAGCSRASDAPREAGVATAPLASASASPPAAPEAPLADASAADAGAPIEARRYQHVLHTGDSMVGGGLCRALKPRFETEGSKFHRDVWESGTIKQFASTDRLPKLLAKVQPDLVLMTLGANDIWIDDPKGIAAAVDKIAKMLTEGGRECWWIGPPIWKSRLPKVVVDILKEHVAPCRFFDSSGIEMQRRPDGIHPTEKGGETWADAFWPALRPGS